MTALPASISAEAAVKSKRKDYVSLLDPKADLKDLKKCHSDPALLKEAVKKLKELGFTVTAVSNCTVRIKSSPALFEKTFGVVLAYAFTSEKIPPEKIPILATLKPASGKAGTRPAAVLSLAGNAEWSGFLDSVFIDSSTTPFSFREEDPDTTKAFNDLLAIYLDEIAGILGADGKNLPTGNGIQVAVLDDNLYVQHPYFAGFRDRITLSISAKWRPSVPATGDLQQTPRPAEIAKGSHGTEVSANLLAVAKDIELHFFASGSDPAGAFQAIPQRILNMSSGGTVSIQTVEFDKKLYWGLIAAMARTWRGFCEAKPRQVVVFANGNANEGTAAQAFLNDLPNVIIVTAALPKLELVDRNGIFASGSAGRPPEATWGACGGRRYRLTPQIDPIDDFLTLGEALKATFMNQIPQRPGATPGQLVATTVAGALSFGNVDLKGEKLERGDGGIRVPCAPSEKGAAEVAGKGHWRYTKGTSFAAPQVAGVCAMILQVWNRATPADVKTVLTETSTPVTGGKTWEGFTLWDPQRGVQVGMVHIGRAVKLASFMNAAVDSDKFKTLRADPNTPRDACVASIIAGELRRRLTSLPSDGPARLVIRGAQPFQNPAHIVERRDALVLFGRPVLR